MTREEKQAELDRHRAIMLATLDFLEEHLGGSIVFDEDDVVTDYYRQQKIQTETYYKQRRLDRLQQQLSRLTKSIENRPEWDYDSYIKEKTGYEINLFENLRKRVAIILAQQEIRSKQEEYDVCTLLRFYQQSDTNGQAAQTLMNLRAAFSKRENEKGGRKRNNDSQIISRVVKDDIEVVSMVSFSGPKPKYYKQHEASSPDGKRKLRMVECGDSKSASTTVSIQFPSASGAVYELVGICLEVNAWWKDNATLMIETRKEYEVSLQHRQVRSFDDVVRIEYLEHG